MFHHTAATVAVALVCHALATVASAQGQVAPWPADMSFGQHRVLVSLNKSALFTTAATSPIPQAVWVDVPWQRRAIPPANTTNVIVTVASTGAVVANALRAPVPGLTSSEAMAFVFEPVLKGDPGTFVCMFVCVCVCVCVCVYVRGTSVDGVWAIFVSVYDISIV